MSSAYVPESVAKTLSSEILDPHAIRAEAYTSARLLIDGLVIPPNAALAATGSLARREMTSYSDLDMVLIHAPGEPVDDEAASALWYPIWDAKYHLDYAIRTPDECAAIAETDVAAALSQLDLTFLAGNKKLVDEARAKLYATWRVSLQKNFDKFIDSSIERWRRAGQIASMTRPEIKNGRGGLRDAQLLRALALGNLCDVPDLSVQRDLLLDVRVLLHEHSRRHRDVLEPEFAAEIADDLGFKDRYELSADLAEAATTISNAVERGLSTARGLVSRRSLHRVRKPLDVDVLDEGGYITLARNANLDDPGLVLRVAAATARTGNPVKSGVWQRLQAVPNLPPRWPRATVDDFFTVLTRPQVIIEMDRHQLWERYVPEWNHIRGVLPRERNHSHTIDYHSVETVARCSDVRTTVGRPDLLLLGALFHDIGKGYGRPHEQVGAEMVARMAQKMGLNLPDRMRVQTLVAEHTTLSKLAARMDPYSDEARNAVLDAVQYDPLTLSLLTVLTEADSKSTGPGVWNHRKAAAVHELSKRGLNMLDTLVPTRPQVYAPADIGLQTDWEDKYLTISWRGSYQREVVRPLAVVAALGWIVTSAAMVREDDGSYAAEFTVRALHERIEWAADEARFIQAYKSGVYSVLPPIEKMPSTANWQVGGVFEVRTVDQRAGLGHVIGKLPDVKWLTMTSPGATMVVQAAMMETVSRAALVRNVTEALSGG